MYLQKQTFKQWHIWGSFCAEDPLCEILCLTHLCSWKPPGKRVILFVFCVKPGFTRRAQLTRVGHHSLLWKAGHFIWRCDHHVPWYHPIFNLIIYDSGQDLLSMVAFTRTLSRSANGRAVPFLVSPSMLSLMSCRMRSSRLRWLQLNRSPAG